MQIVKTLTLIEKSLTLTQIVVKFEQIFYQKSIEKKKLKKNYLINYFEISNKLFTNYALIMNKSK